MNKIESVYNSLKQKQIEVYNVVNRKTKDISQQYFSKKHLREFASTYYYTFDELKQIDLAINSGNIFIKETSQNSIKVNLTAQIYMDKDSENSVEDQFFKDAILDIKDHIFEVKVLSSNVEVSLEIFLPSIFYEHISLSVKTGILDIQNLNCNDLFIQIKNGNLSFQEVESQYSDLNVVNGNVLFENIQLNKLKLSLKNGNLALLNSIIQKFKGNVKYGEVTSMDSKIKEAKVIIKSGDISFVNNDLIGG